MPGLQRTEVVHVDHFGTLVLDLVHPGGRPEGFTELRVGMEKATLGQTFADVPPGRFVAYRGSIGYVEVARRDGSAAVSLGLRSGSVVEVELGSRPQRPARSPGPGA